MSPKGDLGKPVSARAANTDGSSPVSANPSALSVQRDGHVAIISLNRPDALNAINDEIRTGLVQACAAVEGDADIRVVIIRGEGARSFCVGADIKEDKLATTSASAASSQRDYTTAIWNLTKPVIAAIHGFCLGAGLEIALACDIRIACSDATFQFPEINLGLIPGVGGTQRLARLVGLGPALDMMLSAEKVSAQTAYARGIVTRLADDKAALDKAAMELARSIAVKSPTAAAALKRVVRKGLELELPEGLALERAHFTQLLASDDHREAADAFRSKRAPVFKGK